MTSFWTDSFRWRLRIAGCQRHSYRWLHCSATSEVKFGMWRCRHWQWPVAPGPGRRPSCFWALVERTCTQNAPSNKYEAERRNRVVGESLCTALETSKVCRTRGGRYLHSGVSSMPEEGKFFFGFIPYTFFLSTRKIIGNPLQSARKKMKLIFWWGDLTRKWCQWGAGVEKLEVPQLYLRRFCRYS